MHDPRADNLAAAIAASDPLDAGAQTALLGRIRGLRGAMPRNAHNDLSANLDMAVMLTQYLIRMGGIGPREVLQIISRLVGEVELAFTIERNNVVMEGPGRVEEASAGPRPGLRLVGQSEHATGAKLLGEILVQLGHVRQDQLEGALRVQKATGLRIGEALVQTGAVTWEQLQQAVSVQEQLRRAVAG